VGRRALKAEKALRSLIDRPILDLYFVETANGTTRNRKGVVGNPGIISLRHF
jgi:hypothetical protein